MAWLDLIVIVILVVFAIIGVWRGFLKTILSFCGTIVTLALSIWLSKPVSGLLESWFGMTSALANALNSPLTDACQAVNGDGSLSNFFFSKFAEILMGGQYWVEFGGASTPEFVSAFSAKIAAIIAVVISVFIIYILIRIAIAILNKFLDSLTRKRAISGLDRIFGFVLGLVRGALLVMVVYALIFCIVPVIPGGAEFLANMFAQNPVANTTYGWTVSFLQNVILPWLGIT